MRSHAQADCNQRDDHARGHRADLAKAQQEDGQEQRCGGGGKKPEAANRNSRAEHPLPEQAQFQQWMFDAQFPPNEHGEQGDRCETTTNDPRGKPCERERVADRDHQRCDGERR